MSSTAKRRISTISPCRVKRENLEAGDILRQSAEGSLVSRVRKGARSPANAGFRNTTAYASAAADHDHHDRVARARVQAEPLS